MRLAGDPGEVIELAGRLVAPRPAAVEPSAAVLNQGGVATAAISITGPSTRMMRPRIRELAPLALASAQSIARQLGLGGDEGVRPISDDTAN